MLTALGSHPDGSPDRALKSEFQPELQNPRVVRVYRMKKRIACQAIHSAAARSRVLRVRGSIASDDVVAGIAGMRRVVDSELRVVEDVESFDAKLQVPFPENLEMFDQ
jgi:hypothetical protein